MDHLLNPKVATLDTHKLIPDKHHILSHIKI
jgi:hypothetical protein